MSSPIKFLDKKQKEIEKFTQSLIQVKSVNGNETPVAELIKEKLNDYGIKSKLIGKNSKRKNLVAKIKGVSGNKALMFNGHTDVVPAGDIKKWKYPPFSGKILGGKIFGRGARDMKGGVAALTYSAIALVESSSELNGKITLVFNSDEESGNHSGIREVLDSGITADACLVGEPMKDKKIKIGYRGIYRFRIVTRGQTSHTGHVGDKGVNAITKMAKILLALEKSKPRYLKNKLLPPPAINAGTVIRGGIAINIVPDECEALVDCRLSLGQSKKSIKEDISDVLRNLKKKDPEISYGINKLAYVPPFITDKKEQIAKISVKNARKILGNRSGFTVSGAVSDGNLLSARGIPVVSFGADGENTHSENEFAYTKSLTNAAKIYSLTAQDFLK
ncbi:MAG: M20 family metallopeptidase [Candidatus Diapherotrites archaeon]